MSVWQNVDAQKYRSLDYHQQLVQLGDNYPHLERIAAQYQPSSLLEIGSFIGCSLVSLISGSENLTQISVVDNESYLKNSNRICEANVREFVDRHVDRSVDVSFFKSCNKLPTDCFDMINVDGGHTYQWALMDLRFAFDLNPKVILIDDTILIPAVKQAVDDFCEQNNLQFTHIPSAHGIAVIDIEAQTR